MARLNAPSSCGMSPRMACASVSSTRRARSIVVGPAVGCRRLGRGPVGHAPRRPPRLDDRVDSDEPIEQRRQPGERERVLRVALGLRRIFVHFEEHAVDARADARALASGSMYSASPAVTPSPPPGSCRLCVTSKTTGTPSPRIIGNARMSTTRLL